MDGSRGSARARRQRGQSVAEFALILPVLLAFLGLTIDFARVFQAWITLESATRDAAEVAATTATSSSQALTMGQETVCLQAQNVPGFAHSGDVEACTSPAVTVVSFSRSATAPGADDIHPLGSATVRSQLAFRPLFAYPFITQGGTWTITTQASFSVLQNRE